MLEYSRASASSRAIELERNVCEALLPDEGYAFG